MDYDLKMHERVTGFSIQQLGTAIKIKNFSDHMLYVYEMPEKKKRKLQIISLIPANSFKIFDLNLDLSKLMFCLDDNV